MNRLKELEVEVEMIKQDLDNANDDERKMLVLRLIDIQNKIVIEKSKIDLEPVYDSAKSFYGKAKYISYSYPKTLILYSYGYEVARIINGKLSIDKSIEKWDSRTTMRHIREFYRQFVDSNAKVSVIDIRREVIR